MMTPTVMMFIFSPVSGWLSDKFGYKLLRCSGLAIMAAGLFLMSGMTDETSVLAIVLILLLYGFGIGMFTPPNSSLLMGSVPKGKLGVASGMLATSRNLGMMMGVATASAIFTYRLNYCAMTKMVDVEAVKNMYQPYSAIFFSAGIICALSVVIAYMQGDAKTL